MIMYNDDDDDKNYDGLGRTPNKQLISDGLTILSLIAIAIYIAMQLRIVI